MVLGLVLHTCAAFSPDKYWLVNYLHPIAWVDSVNSFIHLFRMPLFFMISGFFAFIMMEKQSVKVFCSVKLLRIGLPFLSVLIFINLPQFFFLQFLLENTNSEDINSNSFVGHLWFLVNLLVYFFLYALLHKSLTIVNPFIAKWPPIATIYAIVWLIPLGYLGILALNKFGIPIYKNIPLLGSIYQLFSYFDYFIVGCLIARMPHQVFIETLQSAKGIGLFLLLLSVSALSLLFPSIFNDISMPYMLHIQAIFVSLLIWVTVIKIINKNSASFQRLSDASYSIYLFHHGIIVILVLLANVVISKYKIEIHSNWVFILIISTTLAITMLFHSFVIKKSIFLSLLFNGKTLANPSI